MCLSRQKLAKRERAHFLPKSKAIDLSISRKLPASESVYFPKNKAFFAKNRLFLEGLILRQKVRQVEALDCLKPLLTHMTIQRNQKQKNKEKIGTRLNIFVN